MRLENSAKQNNQGLVVILGGAKEDKLKNEGVLIENGKVNKVCVIL